MSGLLHQLSAAFLKKRIRHLETLAAAPSDHQERLFQQLIRTAKHTAFGKQHGFESIRSLREFQQRVPVQAYEAFYPWIERALNGEASILWPGKVEWFAKSSGTTNAVSKFIPVTQASLHDCHYKAGKDLAATYLHNRPDSQVFDGKTFSIGGSHEISRFNANARYGDLSAVIIENLPWFYQWRRAPSKRIALMSDWEAKIEAMTRAALRTRVASLMGVPTWTLVILRRMFELVPGEQDVRRLMPHLEAFFHGAVSFTPYRKQFKELIPHADMWYVESYNASEGYFAFQNGRETHLHGMMLLLNHGIFYEFMPLEEMGNPFPKTFGLHEVAPEKHYALVISTNGGLWRYLVGDTLKFTRLNPYEVIVSGRTKHFMNAFGEEVVVENADRAIAAACAATGALVADYTAAPIYFEGLEKGGHEWVIEFTQFPDDFGKFQTVLDSELQRINSDYAAKRHNSMALMAPRVHAAPAGTFTQWLRQRGKLGGQNKVPRLSNTREYIESVLALLNSQV